MNTRVRLLAALCGLLSAAVAAPALAADKGTCGVSGQALASPTITYDPFSPTGLTQVTIPLVLTRFGTGAAKTQTVNFVLTMPVGSPNYQILYNGSSILYTEGNTMGHPTINSQSSGEIYYNFGGASQPDQSTPFNLVVTVPANVDLSAGRPIDFDILYVCNGTGGMADVVTPSKLVSAIHIDVNVLSALQASYAGPPLDFGEVGDKTDADVAATPIERTGYVRVASSGPYSIEVASQNGYRMTFPGGNPAVSNQSLRYSATMLGQTRDPGDPSSITRICMRAGLTGSPPNQGILLPLDVSLLEGGQTKTPAPNYQDILTITVSPLAATTPGTTCP
ncbi:MAG: hypothetical protein MT490_11740 [Sphingomonas sp.]|uniref:hypothetical protein n=1 Tax=Sphingomonas sp. TaxID=28214 RepID=UPI00227320AE|nr:hypothetical protein [Sphingomonas sp.]MCX8476458.1 hypothetical protein [Sphingomonas sp.]